MKSLKSAFKSSNPESSYKKHKIKFGDSERITILDSKPESEPERNWFDFSKFYSSRQPSSNSKPFVERKIVKTNSGRTTLVNDPIELKSIRTQIILSSDPNESLKTLKKYKNIIEKIKNILERYNEENKYDKLRKEFRGLYSFIPSNKNIDKDISYDLSLLHYYINTFDPQLIKLADQNDRILRDKGFLYSEDDFLKDSEDDYVPEQGRASIYGGKKRKTKKNKKYKKKNKSIKKYKKTTKRKQLKENN